jgi:hypothetical protein
MKILLLSIITWIYTDTERIAHTNNLESYMQLIHEPCLTHSSIQYEHDQICYILVFQLECDSLKTNK